MAKKFKGENSKVAAAKEKKAAAQAVRDSKKRAEHEANESATWAMGSKKNDKKAEQEARRLERLARKQEAEALLAAENKKIAQSLKAKTGPPRLAPVKPVPVPRGLVKRIEPEEPDEAKGEAEDEDQDQAAPLDAGSKKALTDSMAALLDRHPEKRAKAAFREFMQREKPRFKLEYPSLRLAQLKHQMWKEWQTSPENPFNKTLVTLNSTAEEIDQIVEDHRKNMQSLLTSK
ncbi:hypothetical protein EC988_000251 [Linderina pennispora]|nr:hypothetical protein EC988_000251 [Linderina pennispora]